MLTRRKLPIRRPENRRRPVEVVIVKGVLPGMYMQRPNSIRTYGRIKGPTTAMQAASVTLLCLVTHRVRSSTDAWMLYSLSFVPEVRCFARGISSETCDRRGASHISHQGFAHNACQVEHQGILSLKYNAAAGTGGQHTATSICLCFSPAAPRRSIWNFPKKFQALKKLGIWDTIE